MSGRLLMSLFLAFLVVFGVALYYFQTFAFYREMPPMTALEVAGTTVPLTGFEGIDAVSSPLKLRGCFRADPQAFAAADPAPDAVPLTAPSWFECFDAGVLTADLEAGAATAYRLAANEPEGFDLMAAVYPDGRGFLWRQLGAEFAD